MLLGETPGDWEQGGFSIPLSLAMMKHSPSKESMNKQERKTRTVRVNEWWDSVVYQFARKHPEMSTTELATEFGCCYAHMSKTLQRVRQSRDRGRRPNK